MNNRTSPVAYVIGILGTLLIVACLVYTMYKYTHPAPVGQVRIEERRKALAEIRQAEAKGLNEYGWVDQSKGIVALPIARAKELMLQDYKNPAALRSNMLARAEVAAFVPPPPPPPPAKPNPYDQ